jgi:Fe2+ or Zn2+ uptake regulation protein
MQQQAAIDRLEDSGYRLTVDRRQVVDLLSSQHEGISAEDLVARLPTVGRATVYRTLRLLVQQGLLCKVSADAGGPRYVLSSRMVHHHHAICVQCGVVREFRENVLERALRSLDSPHGDQVIGHRIEVYILCGSCRAAGAVVSAMPAFHRH